MSLTLPQSFRSPKDDSTAPQQDAAVTERTIFEQVDAIMDAMCGPAGADDLAPSLDEQVKDAQADVYAHTKICDLLREELDFWEDRKREARNKYITLLGKVVQQ